MEDVCLFAHYDKDARVDEYVLRYLSKIRELNFSIVFISAARLSPADVERLRADCCDVILRENAGLDFGSWSAGFAKHRAAIGGRLLLANDSVYGPIGSLDKVIDRLTRTPADFYGLVESVQRTRHLQSWFLLFEPWVVQDETFKAILSQRFITMSKKLIVSDAEIALSQRLVAKGYRYGVLYKNDRLYCVPPRHAINPMVLFWREILFEDGVPFLKIELLRDNPLGVEDAATILKELEAIDPSLSGCVKAHLARVTSQILARRRCAMIRKLYHVKRCSMIRKRYHLKRENRRLAAAWNLMKLETLTAPVSAWRTIQMLLCL
jgi:lipopolysaccharide biosynthesis protein